MRAAGRVASFLLESGICGAIDSLELGKEEPNLVETLQIARNLLSFYVKYTRSWNFIYTIMSTSSRLRPASRD